MAGKKWLVVLGIVNVLALAGIIFWYVNRDNTPPVIIQEAEIEYKETMSDSELLAGVTAMDGKDGDVSHTLVVEKITINENSGTAVVTCGAMDDSGNIAKQSFRMKMKKTVSQAVAEQPVSDPAGEVFTLEAGEAVIDVEDTVEEETTEEETTEETTTEEDAEETEDDEVVEDAEVQEQERPGENPPAEQPNEQSEQPQVNPHEIPELYFNTGEVVTNLGYNPAWVTVIHYLHDNKDSYEELLKNLKITGDYTNSELGTYDVMVSVVDSDGHESVAKPMKIIVVE